MKENITTQLLHRKLYFKCLQKTPNTIFRLLPWSSTCTYDPAVLLDPLPPCMKIQTLQLELHLGKIVRLVGQVLVLQGACWHAGGTTVQFIKKKTLSVTKSSLSVSYDVWIRVTLMGAEVSWCLDSLLLVSLSSFVWLLDFIVMLWWGIWILEFKYWGRSHARFHKFHKKRKRKKEEAAAC